jgi:hypothetical protein
LRGAPFAAAEEDHRSARAAQALVSGRRDDVAVLEGVVVLLIGASVDREREKENERTYSGRDEAADVGNVGHKVRAVLVCDLAAVGNFVLKLVSFES